MTARDRKLEGKAAAPLQGQRAHRRATRGLHLFADASGARSSEEEAQPVEEAAVPLGPLTPPLRVELEDLDRVTNAQVDAGVGQRTVRHEVHAKVTAAVRALTER